MTDFVKVELSLREDWPVVDINVSGSGANAEIPQRLLDTYLLAYASWDAAQKAILKHVGAHTFDDVDRLEPLDG